MEIPVLLGYSIIRFYVDERFALLGLTALFLVLLQIEYVRLEAKLKIPSVIDVLRPRERNNVTGSIFFVAATIIVFSAFDYGIALTALLLTIFGDLVSALIGIKYGKHKIFKKKTLEGFLAGLGANLCVGVLLIPAFAIIFIPMAVIASLVELITNKLDDNLTVPLFAGFTGQMIALVMQVDLTAFPGPLSFFFSFLSLLGIAPT